MEGIRQVIESSAKEVLELNVQERKEFIKDLVISHYQKAQVFTNVTIAGSYVAFFTAWAKTQNDFPLAEKYFSLMLMLFSLAFFLGWEIFKMIKTSTLMKDQIEITLATANDFQKLLQKLVKKEQDFISLNIRVWPGILVLTITPAIMAATIFLYGCLKILFWP